MDEENIGRPAKTLVLEEKDEILDNRDTRFV